MGLNLQLGDGQDAAYLWCKRRRSARAAPQSMDVVGTFVVVVRIRRARRPPQVRAFEVHIVLPAGQWAAPSVLDVVASVLTLVRSHPRAQPRRPGRPGRKGLAKSREQSALR